MFKKNRLISIILILSLIALGYGGFYYYKKNKNKSIYEFDTQPVKVGPLTQSVTAVGTLNPVINVQVGSQISGNIQKLYADFNSQVKAGQVVAQIDTQIYKAAVTQAEGSLANAKAVLALAQIQLKRAQNLRGQDSTPQANLDQAIATVDQATAQVKSSQGALELAQANLDHCSITSPVDGIVITRNVNEGQTVAAGLNAPVIFVIANDLSKMQIDTNVSEADVGNIKADQDVDFLVDAYPYVTFQGKIVQVRNSPTTVQNVVTYDAVVGVSNPDFKLKPGMTTNLSIITAQKETVIQIPNASFRVRIPDDLLPKEGKRSGATSDGGRRKNDPSLRFVRTIYQLKEDGQTPVPVKIKIGITDGIYTEVTEGLKEGDKVITSIANTQFSGASQQTASPFGPPKAR